MEYGGRHGKARIAVLTTLTEEFSVAQRVFGADENVPNTRAFTAAVTVGRPKCQCFYPEIVYRSPSRGTGEAQAATQTVIEQFRPDFLFLLGIAGGVAGRDDVALGDVVVPDYIYYGEYMKIVKGRVLRRDGPTDQPSRYLHDLVEPIRVAHDWHRGIESRPPVQLSDTGPRVLIAPLLTTEKVLADEGNAIQATILEFYDNAVAVDMESAGFARGVFLTRRQPRYNPQLIVIRGISDFIQTPANKEQRESWKAYASEAAAQLSRALADKVLAAWPESI
jgi:nucleoside phosphorylase